MREGRYPLEGIRVVDLTTMINGPFAAVLLADMGADVVKIEPPGGDPWRSVGGGFLSVNRNKRSIVLDLKKEPGRQIARKLIRRADVLVENARWGVWHRLELDYESLKEENPNLVYLSVLGHGSNGPFSELPGYDPLFQARSGQMVGQGGIDKPPVFHQIPLNDLGAPMLGAYGAILALLVRARTGKGQHVEMSLTNASIALQSGEFIDADRLERKNLGDPEIRGLNATHRHYRAADGRWVFILCPREVHWRNLCRAAGLETLPTDPRFETSEKRLENDAALVEILSAAFATRGSEEWMEILKRADVPAAISRTGEELFSDPHCEANGLFFEAEHPQFGRIRQYGPAPRFSEMEMKISGPAPVLGQHTEEVLRELGCTEAEISDLIFQKVAFPPAEPV